MSFMAAVERVSDGKVVLDLKGKPLVTAYLSEELFLSTDEKVWQQAVHAASYPGVKAVYLMPDTHLGYGVPIGSVVVTENTVIPAAVGYDISCGVLCMETPLTVHDIAPKEKRRQWIQEVERRVAMGLGSRRADLMLSTDSQMTEEACHRGAAASWLGVKPDLCERPFLPVPDDWDPQKFKDAWKPAPLQLGSLGAGNHFIEMQVEQATGAVWVMIHSGSRGFGHKIATHFLRRLKQEQGVRQDDTWARVDSDTGKEYLAAHNAAANYAIANRHVMASAVDMATQVAFSQGRCRTYYEISHNLVQHESYDLVSHGYVHRKGATRAFPGKHSDLHNSRWWEKGHPCLIPGSMATGAAILFAEDSEGAGFSVNHGSGRVMGRKQAKELLGDMQKDINAEMDDAYLRVDGVKIESILSNHRDIPLDECGHAYKDLDKVLGVLESEGVARIAHRMFPVANIKG